MEHSISKENWISCLLVLRRRKVRACQVFIVLFSLLEY